MLLHTDIPTRAEVDRLLRVVHPGSVSIYVPTDPASPGQRERLAFAGLAGDAVLRLRERGRPRAEVAAVEERLDDLADDEETWDALARSLAVFATAESIAVLRLPNVLEERVEVADRFALAPLLRTLTFPQLAYVLALGQNAVRLLEVLPDAPPYEVRVPDLPRDIVDAVGVPSVRGRGHRGRIHGSEGRKVRMTQYVRRVDQALRPVLRGGVPLVLAANEPLASLYRASSTYPDLAPGTLRGNAETTADADLAARARDVLDELYAAQLQDAHALFAARGDQGRAAVDPAGIARAATHGMVDTVLVDIDDTTRCRVDGDGALTFAPDTDPSAPRLVDEIVRLVWAAGGRVLAVRGADVPHGAPAAAILRYVPVLAAPEPG